MCLKLRMVILSGGIWISRFRVDDVGIIHRLYNDVGNECAAEFIDNIQKIVTNTEDEWL